MSDGTMDYGAGRFKIVGGPDDGHEFHAGDCFEVWYKGHWLPVVIEARNGGWLFLYPIDAKETPTDLYGLSVRRAV